jgi:hypothetical protein
LQGNHRQHGHSWQKRILESAEKPLSIRRLRVLHARLVRQAEQQDIGGAQPIGFGWIKTVGGQRKTKFKGRERGGWAFTFTVAAYNLVRLPKLLDAVA